MIRKSWIKSNGNSSIFPTWLYSHEYNIIYHLLPNVWKASYAISASIFVDIPYWPPYSTDKLIYGVLSDTSQWLFHFGEEIEIVWTHIRWLWWMFQNLPLPVAHKVPDSSSGAISCIAIKNDGVLYHEVTSFSSECWTMLELQERASRIICLGRTAWSV